MSREIQPTRQYTDREVRAILESAVDLQQHADHGEGASGGMSLAEIEQVAAEAGLDPALVRRAAAQLDTVGPPPDSNVFLGSPTHLVIERAVEVVIDPDQFDRLLDVTRGLTHEVGEVSTIGRQFGWKGRLDGAKTEVSASADDRGTTLRVRVELDEVALGHFMLKTVLLGVGGGFVGTAVAATALGPAGLVAGAVILGTGYAWSRHGLGTATTRYRVRAHELIEALVARLHEVGEPSARPAPSPPAALPNA